MQAHGSPTSATCPQDEIVHRELTVVEALRYAARLRLPRTPDASDIDERGRRACSTSSSLERACRDADRLALGRPAQARRGGDRAAQPPQPAASSTSRRPASIPGLETRHDGAPARAGRHVAARSPSSPTRPRTSTCATRSRDGPRRRALLLRPARRGAASSSGPTTTTASTRRSTSARPPSGGREFEAASAGDGARRSRSRRAAPAAARPARRAASASRLASRRCSPAATCKLMLRDRRNLALLLGQVPLIALANRAALQGGRLRPATIDTNNAALLLFLVVTSMIWLGSIDAAREIIKERAAVRARDARSGCGSAPTWAPRSIVLFGLVAVQTPFCSAPSSSGSGRCTSRPATYLALFVVARGHRVRRGRRWGC